jgi:chromatin remodeling complex protein RSC6
MATRKGGARKGAAKRGGAAKKGGRKSVARSGGRKAAGSRRASGSRGGAKRAKRAPNPAFMRPMQPTEELGAVVGARPMPRTEVTKRLWDYIRKNGLQDQKNRRQINADDRLRAVFGGRRQVSMFEMTKLVNQHLKNA